MRVSSRGSAVHFPGKKVIVNYPAAIPILWALMIVATIIGGPIGRPSVSAQPIPPGTVTITEDIKATRHNLSSTSQEAGDITSTTSEVCVFCHTPHGSSSTGTALLAPLWNRNLTQPGYILYDQAWSFSFEGALNDPSKPTGYSRLCLSCHDDTIALGSVINAPGSGGFQSETPTANVLGVGGVATPGKMSDQPHAVGSGVLSGDTRVLGTDLRNDHPISFLFDSNLAVAVDAELVNPGAAPASLNAVTPLAPAGGYKTGVKRYPGLTTANENVQCTSCHNPHAKTYPKFLRAPRLQNAGEKEFLPGALPAADHPAGQIICLYCHSKPGWSGSTHDASTAIRSKYPSAAPPLDYDFDGIHSVGQVACRNCHDPHTAQGAKRLHREGFTVGGASEAIENTCFLCHSPNTQALAGTFLPAGDPTNAGQPRFCGAGVGCINNSPARIAPDIFSEFYKDNSSCTGSGGAGTGSAMCLQLPILMTAHEPVFISRSQEGVQLKSEGVQLFPINNEESPGISSQDETHVECVDCHNPHQVNSPNNAAGLAYNGAPNPGGAWSPGIADAQGKGGRFKGMKGVGIDATGARPIIVGKCEPGFVICGTDITINAIHPLLGSQISANRDPYVYEICFRCHGNSYSRMFGVGGPGIPAGLLYPDNIQSLTIPPNYASKTSIQFSSRTDPTNGAVPGTPFSYKGFSNKWLEFNPETDDVESSAMFAVDVANYGQTVRSHTQQSMNPAYHPVVVPGRNRSPQLCKQLSRAFGLATCDTPDNVMAPAAAALNYLSNLTIQCTDCHNNDKYDAYGDGISPVTVLGQNAYSPGVDDSGLRGPLTESNLRPTDVWPALDTEAPVVLYGDNTNGRPVKPIGPHGSFYRRLLRANYNTDILAAGRCFEQGNPNTAPCLPPGGKGDGYTSNAGAGGHTIAGGGVGSDNAHYGKFLLCFNCHDRRAFDPDAGSDQDRTLTRFFGLNSTAGVDSWWNGNLHMYHLRWSGAMCHECHYNVHSNVEALNTIYGNGMGGDLPPDGKDDDNAPDGVIGTHLINFGPTVEGTREIKPQWIYEGSAFRCYLRCHNEVMDSCAYQANQTGTPNARWCAGGRNPGTSG